MKAVVIKRNDDGEGWLVLTWRVRRDSITGVCKSTLHTTLAAKTLNHAHELAEDPDRDRGILIVQRSKRTRYPKVSDGIRWSLVCVGSRGCGVAEGLGHGQTALDMALERALLHDEDAHSRSMIPVGR